MDGFTRTVSMTNPSTRYTGAARVDVPLNPVSLAEEDWRLARGARVNLLLVGPDRSIPNTLTALLPDLREPIATWSPGQPFTLPPASQAGTVILYDVGALGHDDQLRLLTWLDQAVGRTQVVSTASAPLLPRVEAGAFIDTLYYRLNVVLGARGSRLARGF
jgi:hypothetical protein